MLKELLQKIEDSSKSVFIEKYDRNKVRDFDFRVYQKNNSTSLNVEKLEGEIKKKNGKYILECRFNISNDEKYSELYLRSVRFDFLTKLKQKLESLKDTFTSVNVKSDTGGRNPRIELEHGKKLKIVLALKYDGKNINITSSIKPKDITPKIVDDWLYADEIKDRIITYINSSNFFTSDENVKSEYVKIVNESVNSHTTYADDKSIYSDISSEFFEILSALKLAVLICKGDKEILSTINFVGNKKSENIDFDTKDVKILIPSVSNFRLIDFFISYKKNPTQENSLKISVKSKVSSSSSATVKFNTIFSKDTDVEDWYKESKDTDFKKNNLVQKLIAESSTFLINTKKESLYPIYAIYNILDNNVTSLNSDLRSFFKTSDISGLKKIMELLHVQLYDTQTPSYAPLDLFFKDEDKLLKMCKEIMSDKLKRTEIDVEYEQVNNKILIKGTQVLYPFTLNNFSFVCEKFLVEISERTGVNNINFYQLFFDNVLIKNLVIYSIVKKTKVANKDEMRIEYNFLSSKNFQRYETWIGLRSKNNVFNVQDSLGLDL